MSAQHQNAFGYNFVPAQVNKTPLRFRAWCISCLCIHPNFLSLFPSSPDPARCRPHDSLSCWQQMKCGSSEETTRLFSPTFPTPSFMDGFLKKTRLTLFSIQLNTFKSQSQIETGRWRPQSCKCGEPQSAWSSRDPWRSLGPYSRHGAGAVCSGHHQFGFRYLQRWRLHNSLGQLPALFTQSRWPAKEDKTIQEKLSSIRH